MVLVMMVLFVADVEKFSCHMDNERGTSCLRGNRTTVGGVAYIS